MTVTCCHCVEFLMISEGNNSFLTVLSQDCYLYFFLGFKTKTSLHFGKHTFLEVSINYLASISSSLKALKCFMILKIFMCYGI